MGEVNETANAAVMRSIGRLREVEESARLALVEVVAAARAQGWSWDHIGGMLGISRQAAAKRYGGD